jgi:hypothetical protein
MMETSENDEEKTCEICQEDKKECYCKSCSKYFCEDCWSHVHKKGANKTHQKMSPNELKEMEDSKKNSSIFETEIVLEQKCFTCKKPSLRFCTICINYTCKDCWNYIHKDQDKKDHKISRKSELKKLEDDSKYKVGEVVVENTKKKIETFEKLKADSEAVLLKWKEKLSESHVKKLEEIVQKCNDDLEKSLMLIMGRTSSGKTSLVNWFLGEDVGIVKSGKATSFISYYLPQGKENENGETLVEEMFSEGSFMKSFSFSKTKSPSEVNQERKTFIEDYLEKEITEKSNMKRVDHSNIYVKSNLLEYVKIVDSQMFKK